MAADTGAGRQVKFPIGSLVVTPSNRIARVIRSDDDGRLHLEYQDCDPRLAPVIVLAKLLKPANEQPYV